ncbi:MAG: hypothetical protein MI976_04895 [Pseudomonadales bacterium]|nr:hypothetical protein [Pseudomonadales bacterium]
MKYGNRPQLAKLLGQLFLLRLQADLHNQQPYPQLLVPIPMHTAKQRRRGFNQSIYVAQTIGRDLKIPVTVDCLRKAKLTDAQKNLNRTQRLHNLKNSLAFNPRYKKAFAHIDHVALVDDVITTGATMYEASRILKEQGVARVDIWALARTP